MASADRIRRRIANLSFGLTRSGLATEDEIASVASVYEGKTDIESLYSWWAELKALGLARMAERRKSGPVTEQELEIAARALAEKSETVQLRSIDQTVHVHPASFARIELIEERSFWISILEAGRSLLLGKTTAAKQTPASPSKLCPSCGRPQEPGKLDEYLQGIGEELRVQRAMLYAQVVAPGPAPCEPDGEPAVVDWADRITPIEERLLLQAYHRVNFDVIRNLPQPMSTDGKRELPESWAFLFASMSLREKRPAREVMRNPSLGAIIATFVLEELNEAERKKKREKKVS